MTDQIIANVLSEATLEEKVRLLTGHHNWYTYDIKRLRLPSIAMADGPHGIRKTLINEFGKDESYPSTCFPPSSALAATFNERLVKNIGVALGKEARAHNVQILLGPGINIKRNPLCGRNFEYFSEDPVLTGKLAAAMISGVQSQGVSACVKHFLANNQEKDRFISNSVVDERALNEIYLKPFEIAIKEANPWALMTCYNRVNGKHVNDIPDFIEDILRKRWNYQGLAMTDWGAYVDPVTGLKSGLDLQMPGGLGPFYEVEQAILEGKLDMETLDASVIRHATTALKVREIDKDPVPKVDYNAHFELARKAASEALVLLKNEKKTLPLNHQDEVLFIGPYIKNPHYQGFGSSRVNPAILDNAFEALKKSKLKYTYLEGFSSIKSEITQDKIAEIQELARQVKKVVFFAGLNDYAESEGYDRRTLSLPSSQNELISALTKVNDNVIVVITAGSPVTMPWIDQVNAAVFNYLGGAASGHAIVDVLTGAVNPSGRLPETFPLSYEDVPSQQFGKEALNVEYRESIFVGYRYYEKAKRPVLFPFGHGLSYTTFKYDNLLISEEVIDEKGKIKVEVDVTNVGDIAGAEVVQVYVSQDHPAIFKPARTLQAFKKVGLRKGEKKTVKFTLTADDFSYYNVQIQNFALENGVHRIQIGTSVSDIVLTAKVVIKTKEKVENISYRKTAPIYYNLPEKGPFKIRFREFEAIFAEENVAKAHYYPRVDRPFTLLNTMSDGVLYRSGRIVIKQVKRVARKRAKGDPELAKQIELSSLKMPLASIAAVNGLSYCQVLGLLDIMNGKILRGLWRALFGGKKAKPKPKHLSRLKKKIRK
ncbi:MAG: beta-glucosidase [Bacilli bacterium]